MGFVQRQIQCLKCHVFIVVLLSMGINLVTLPGQTVNHKFHTVIPGKLGQTEKLTCVSLMYQTDSGLKHGYKESEIGDAVICAISPQNSLRSYVETLCDFSLTKLRRILSVHYQEKAASQVYQQLAIVCQQSNESPQQFLLHALDLCNFASQESD